MLFHETDPVLYLAYSREGVRVWREGEVAWVHVYHHYLTGELIRHYGVRDMQTGELHHRMEPEEVREWPDFDYELY